MAAVVADGSKPCCGTVRPHVERQSKTSACVTRRT